MELQDTWQEFTTLPPDAQALVADFIAFLKQRHQQPQSPEESQSTGQPNQQNWREDPFIGIWEDREDMQDSTQLVRTIRDSEWRS